MDIFSYTIEQAEFLNYVKNKVHKIFTEHFVPAHGIEHISRVADWCKRIALGEKARSILLCELAGWLHDVGRAFEENPGENSRKHHELSYQVLRQWFRQDDEFNFLTEDEKLELLYAVRYHWNNEANKYDTAWILRDADKLDGFGKIGIERGWQLVKGDVELWNQHFRHLYDCHVHIHTKTARKIIEKEKLMEPVDKAYVEYLKSQIEPIEL